MIKSPSFITTQTNGTVSTTTEITGDDLLSLSEHYVHPKQSVSNHNTTTRKDNTHKEDMDGKHIEHPANCNNDDGSLALEWSVSVQEEENMGTTTTTPTPNEEEDENDVHSILTTSIASDVALLMDDGNEDEEDHPNNMNLPEKDVEQEEEDYDIFMDTEEKRQR
eukprot:CAMPEP_0195296956 /NCGR_PEP_ID=MMETSP0707-20130614/20500_1 /TAXON_ID=33640 /ORGANISM="Asterionellopsis glacialis, Strain CCMP134" /LENGTH=164 /DNA_ID=CAMNT_0040358607 /DNA_START=390 /DNA_END=884 /DNA_ORIENTATION=+